MAKLIILVGIPGSGKSTYAKRLLNDKLSAKAKAGKAVILSSDEIREELYGDEGIQGYANFVFDLMYQRLQEHAAQRHTIIFDATNITRVNRANIFTAMKKFRKNYEISAIYFDASEEFCQERNKMRMRYVPAKVISYMAKAIEKPSVDEGFDAIVTFRR